MHSKTINSEVDQGKVPGRSTESGGPFPPTGNIPKSGKSWLTGPALWVFLLILALRMAFVIVVPGGSDEETWLGWVMSPDSRDYVYLADDFSDGRQDSISFRMPLYPAFIALTQYLLGRRWLTTLLLQQIAVALTAIACGIVAASACGRRAGQAASITYLICPLALIESVVLLPDIMLAMVVSWAGVLWLRALRAATDRGRILDAALSGFLLGAGTLVKPSVSLLLLVPLVQLAFSKKIPAGKRLLTGTILAIAALCPPGAWRLNNLIRFNSPVLTTQDSFELAGRFLILSGQETQESFWLECADSLESYVVQEPIVYENPACTVVPDGWAGLGGGRFCPSVDIDSRDSLFRSVAISALRRAPLRIVIGHFNRWPWLLSNPIGDLSRAGGHPVIRGVVRAGSMAFQVLLAVGALLALVQRRLRGEASELLFFSIALFLIVAVVTGPLAGTRYSLPFYWALISAASCGWVSILSKTATVLGRPGVSSTRNS